MQTLAEAFLAVAGPDAPRSLAKFVADLPAATRMRLQWIEGKLTLRLAVARLAEAGLRVAGHDESASVADPAAAVSDLLAGTGRFVYLDTEAPRVPPDYETLLEDFAAASAGAFAPHDVEQSMELVPDDEDRRVRFRCGAEAYDFTAKNRGDWYDVDSALAAIHRALSDAGRRESFVELLPDGQCRRFVFADEAAFKKAAAALHLPLSPRTKKKSAKRPARKKATARTRKR